MRAYFLGGLNEIGKNFTLFECENDMVIVDCGLAFPDEEMPGIDAVIPDFTFVEKNKDASAVLSSRTAMRTTSVPCRICSKDQCAGVWHGADGGADCE